MLSTLRVLTYIEIASSSDYIFVYIKTHDCILPQLTTPYSLTVHLSTLHCTILHTMPYYIPCHITYHAILHTMPYYIPCHITYHAILHTMPYHYTSLQSTIHLFNFTICGSKPAQVSSLK